MYNLLWNAMKIISEILFTVSNGLMIPVVLLLLCLLARAIWILAGLYGDIKLHRRVSSVIKDTVRNYSYERLQCTLGNLTEMKGCMVTEYFARIMDHKDDHAYCDHELADFQVDVQKILVKYRMLIKFGPMLGLMGTLIPMGPALVGLAVGDISSMAYNMQMAFATTVIGMLVAGIGLISLQLNQRYYATCYNDLEFIIAKIMSE